MSKRTLKGLFKSREEHTYLHISPIEVWDDFVKQCEAEGLTWADGRKLSEVDRDDVVALTDNMTFCYGVFDEFLGKIEDVSPDVVGAIAQMKNQIDNDIFREWCDQLIACQSDSTLKDTLPAIVEKLTAVRLVNSEMRIPLSEARREYYLMVAITVANIPLLYFINQEWYEMLMYSVVGKLVLAITALVILITAMRTARLTKPIEYKL